MAAKISKKGNDQNNMIIIAIVAIIVVALVLLFIFWPSAPPKEGNIGAKGTLSELAPGAAEAINNINMMKADASVKMAISIGDDPEQSTKVNMDIDLEYDKKAKKMHIIMSTEDVTSGQKDDVEIYIIDDVYYTKTIDVTGDAYWIKQALVEEFDTLMETQGLEDLLETLEGEVVGTETINGKQATKIKVVPNVKDLLNSLLESQASNLTALGVSQAEINEVADMLEKSIKKLELFIWVTDDLPVRIDADVSLEVDSGGLSALVGGNIEAEVDLLFNADYDSPVKIELPEDALNATDLSGFYPNYDNPAYDYEDRAVEIK